MLEAHVFKYTGKSHTPPPSVTTEAASEIGATTATLNSTINPNGSTTRAYFFWGTGSSTNQTPSQDVGSGNIEVNFSQTITGLACETTYSFFIAASGPDTMVAASTRSFTTAKCPSNYFTVTPCRVVDTRIGPPLDSQVEYEIQVAGNCDVPFSAKAVAANITAASPTGHGHLTIWPQDLPRRLVSAINYSPNQTRANNAIITLSTNGSGAIKLEPIVTDSGTVHFILDVMGYFE